MSVPPLTEAPRKALKKLALKNTRTADFERSPMCFYVHFHGCHDTAQGSNLRDQIAALPKGAAR
jgi:hypothetical protein